MNAAIGGRFGTVYTHTNHAHTGINTMNNTPKRWIAPARAFVSAAALTAVGCLFSSVAVAQQSMNELFNAFDITEAQVLEQLVVINNNPSTQTARNDLKTHLEMTATMDSHEMMAAGMDHGDAMEGLTGPYSELEVEARVALIEGLRGQATDDDVLAAIENSAPINQHTAAVFKRGRGFENQLYTIYTDNSVTNKQAAVAAAIEEYLSDDRHSVSLEPKNSTYLVSHPHAGAFKAGFPRLSGLLWSNQWMRLAAIEAVILEQLDSEFAGGIDTALERYWNKVGSAGGMTMFPAPTELPMAPAISPNLYSQSEQAAVILDNLNILQAIVADILAYPNLDERGVIIDQLIGEYTNKESNLSNTNDYLLFALRSGIYNQGGPAVGALMQSERNRSRADMNMQHTMIMSSPQ